MLSPITSYPVTRKVELPYWGVCVRWRGRWGVGYRIQCNVDVGQSVLLYNICFRSGYGEISNSVLDFAPLTVIYWCFLSVS